MTRAEVEFQLAETMRLLDPVMPFGPAHIECGHTVEKLCLSWLEQDARLALLEAVAREARRDCHITDYKGVSHNMLEEALSALDARKGGEG